MTKPKQILELQAENTVLRNQLRNTLIALQFVASPDANLETQGVREYLKALADESLKLLNHEQ